MNLTNLEKGQRVKSYRAMCELLGEEVKTGKSKMLQLDDWGRYFTHRKEGNSFVIEDIKDVPLEKIDRRGGNNVVYSKYIQKLVLDMLSNEKCNGVLFMSCNQLLRQLQMVNEFYSPEDRSALILSKVLKVDKAIVNDFYGYTHRKLKTALEGALSSLENKSLLVWTKKMTVCVEENGRKDYREATQQEIDIIIKCEGEALHELGYKDKQSIVLGNLVGAFRKNVQHRLEELSTILFYYKSYEIITNKPMLEKRLDDLERQGYFKELNRVVIEQTYKTIETKHSNVISKYSNYIGDVSYSNLTEACRGGIEYVDKTKMVANKVLSVNPIDK